MAATFDTRPNLGREGVQAVGAQRFEPPLDALADVAGLDREVVQHLADECDALVPILRGVIEQLDSLTDRVRAAGFTPIRAEQYAPDIEDALVRLISDATGLDELCRLAHDLDLPGF